MSEQEHLNNNDVSRDYLGEVSSLEELVVDESDIFRYLVRREDVSLRETKEALKMFFNRLPINIFKNEYYILYKVLSYAYKYNATFNEGQLFDILSNNKESLLKDKNIMIHRNVEDELERLEYIFLSVQNTLDDLKTIELDGDVGSMMLSLKLYIDIYVKDRLQAVTLRYAKMVGGDIKKTNNMEYTVEESTEVFENAKKLLLGLLNEQVEMLSEDINTKTMSVEDILDRFNEEGRLERVANYGIESLDNALGGITKSNYVAVQAGGGVGKSRFGVVNIGYNALMLGKNVLVDSLELPSQQVFAMFLARHILETRGVVEGLDSNNLYKRNSLTEEQLNYFNTALIDLMTNPDYGNLLIQDKQLKEDMIESNLESVWDSGFHFDLYCLDYIGLVLSGKRNSSKHERVSNVSNYLKSAVKNFKGVGFAAIIVAQLTRESESALLDGEDSAKLGTADSNDIQRDCDVMITLHTDDEMKVVNKMKLFVEKSRHVDVSAISKLDLETDLGRCFFQES